MNDEVFIPQYITKWGIMTSFGLFGFSFLAYKYKYYILAVLCLCVFITSVLHWHKQTLFGIVRFLDVSLVAIIFLLVTFHYKDLLKPEYKSIWNIIAIMIIVVFLFNSIITYFQITHRIPNQKCQYEYNYFSLDCTEPNTLARTDCYYHTTFVHLLFIHVIPCAILAYFFIKSHSSTF